MTSGQLVIVRHGRTAYNAQGRLQGRTDNPLDDVGREQAARVARHLKATVDGNSLVVCSPLVRAQQTAQTIANELALEMSVDERWIEIDYGTLEGLRQIDVPGDIWSEWRRNPSFAPEQGESLVSVQERVASACDDLMDRLEGRTAVIVTHVSPIKSSMAWALGVDVGVGWRTQLDTASVTRIALTPRGPVLRTFNEIAP